MTGRLEYGVGSGDRWREITRRNYTSTTRLWGRCPRCGYTWQWNGPTENVGDAEASIAASSCYCHPAWGRR